MSRGHANLILARGFRDRGLTTVDFHDGIAERTPHPDRLLRVQRIHPGPTIAFYDDIGLSHASERGGVDRESGQNRHRDGDPYREEVVWSEP